MKKPHKAAAAPKAPTPDDLLTAAQGQIAAGRYREAISTCKDLLKIENRQEWRQTLACAYAGRARELAAKGMTKEALTVWENRTQIAPELPADLDYMTLLLRLGRISQAVALGALAGDRLDPATLTALRSQLAAHHLAGKAEVAAGLAADDPILVQGVAAAQALDAYCAGDDAALGAALAAIPFRSPYRDLAQILKALQRPPAALHEALELLARVDDASGFAPLRRTCESALGPPQTLTERLADAGEATRRFAMTLAGWGEQRQAIWEEARRAGNSEPKTLLRLLHRHRTLLGETWARRQGLRLLVAGFPKSAGWIKDSGGPQLSAEERLLIAAWRAEHNERSGNDLDAWDAYAQHLMKDRLPEPGTDDALRVALVLRRVDSHRDLLSHLVPDDDPFVPTASLAEAVESSLQFDPDDRDSYERLVRFYLRGPDLKSARRLLDLGLARFPADVGLLTAAMDVALAADAHKKAARYAREILALDPINTGARERLVKSHLAHARKQLKACRLDLASKELEQAAEWEPAWDRGGRLRERRVLLSALLELQADAARGASVLGAQVQAMGGGMAAALALALEGAAIGRAAAGLLKTAGLGKAAVADQADLTAVLSRLRTYLDEEAGAELAPELRRLFEKPLSAAARWPLSQPESENACETLRRAALEQARLAFAEAALKRWPDVPIFELHRFEAGLAGRRGNPAVREIDRLAEAGERARESGDQRTAHRIGECLAEYSPFGHFGRSPFFPFDDEDEDEDEDGMGFDPLGGDLNDALRAFIEVVGVDGVLKAAGVGAKERSTFKDIERQLGHETMINVLITMLGNQLPNLLGGLPPGLLPAPGPAPKPSRPGRKPGKPTGRSNAPQTPDDDDPEQFDLF